MYGAFLLIVGFLFISRIKVKKPQNKEMILFIIIGIIEIALIIMVRKLLWYIILDKEIVKKI